MTVTSRVIKDIRFLVEPKVYNRRQWGNKSSVYQIRRRTRKHAKLPSDTVWQHITVTPAADFSMRFQMQLLHRIGMERFGSGVSYNLCVDVTTGEIGLGQSFDAKGTHTLNDKNIPNYSFDQNLVSHALAVIAMPGAKPSGKCVDSLAACIAAMVHQKVLTPIGDHDYNPHSMVAFKDCPTDAVRAIMDDVQRQAKVYVKKLHARDAKRKKN